jgi:predicted permease
MRDHTIGGLPRAWAHLLVDVRLALRSLRRDRSFALAAIGTLALAISLNATVFTVADAMLFRGYSHVRQNERLVYLQERSGAGLCCISYPDFEDWRAQARTFAGMAFVASNRQITFRDGNGRPSDLVTFLVSPNTFALLGVAPLLGRDFTAADAVPGAPQVAMLNHRFWTTRFARRADVIGSAVEINGMPATIVGVMPEGFDFPTQENLWMPIVPSPDLLQRGLTPGGFIAVGRLRAGVSRNEARSELETINRRLAAAYPATNRNLIPTVMTHSQANSGEDAQIIWGSVWAGAWFVLLIACANLANLTLVRTMRRWRELATRIALGAGQTRMMRLMLIEGVLLAALAAGIGWWITIWSVRVWAETTASQYQILDYTVDSRTLVYLLAVSLVAAILISLGPMVRVMQLGAGGALKGDARGVTQSLRTKHLAAGLVAGQMALAIILLSGAGVLTRSLANIVGADTGVRAPEQVLVGATRLPTDKYPSDSARRTHYDELQTRLRAAPGVEAVSMASAIPVQSMAPRIIEVDGRPRTPDTEEAVAFVRALNKRQDHLDSTPRRAGAPRQQCVFGVLALESEPVDPRL